MLRLRLTLFLIWLNMNTHKTSNMNVDINTIIKIQNKVIQVVFVLVPTYGIVLVAGTNDL